MDFRLAFRHLRHEEEIINAIVRWAGSKRRLVPRLSEYWSEKVYSRYVEPFSGSACLFFGLEPGSALLGDLNSELIESYRAIRDTPLQVAEALSQWGTDKDSYYAVRALRGLESSVERAARFLYLNRLCFNGLYRTNKRGEFNVPYGGARSGPMPTGADLSRAATMLTRADLLTGDFGDVLTRTRKGDFVYLDPPYRVTSRRMFRDYQAGAFSVDDLARLREWLDTLNARGIAFLVSYADSREGRELADGFSSHRVQVRRNIAGFAKHRRTAYEILITNCLRVAA